MLRNHIQSSIQRVRNLDFASLSEKLNSSAAGRINEIITSVERTNTLVLIMSLTHSGSKKTPDPLSDCNPSLSFPYKSPKLGPLQIPPKPSLPDDIEGQRLPPTAVENDTEFSTSISQM